MTSVNIAEVKDRLSHYLRLVRRGEALLVRDRDQVIARIDPAGDGPEATGSDAGRLADLERRGILRRRRAPIDRGLFESRPRADGDVVTWTLSTVEITSACAGSRERGRSTRPVIGGAA